MKLPDAEVDLDGLKFTVDAGQKLFGNPVANYFLNQQVYMQGNDDNEYAFVRCVSSIADSRPQTVYETTCPPGTLTGKNLCWHTEPPPTRNRLLHVVDLSGMQTWQKAAAICRSKGWRLASPADWKSISRHRRLFDADTEEYGRYYDAHSQEKRFKFFSNLAQTADGADILMSLADAQEFWTSDPEVSILPSRTGLYPVLQYTAKKSDPQYRFFICVSEPLKRANNAEGRSMEEWAADLNNTTDPFVRMNAENYFSRLGPSSLPSILSVLKPDLSSFRNIVQPMGTDAVSEIFSAYLKEKEPKIRAVLFNTLEVWKEELPESELKRLSLSLISSDEQERFNALELVILYDRRASALMNQIIPLCRNERNGDLRAKAYEAAFSISDRWPEELVIDGLNDRNTGVQTVAARMTQSNPSGNEKILDSLKTLARQGNTEKAIPAIHSLGKLSRTSPSAILCLGQLLLEQNDPYLAGVIVDELQPLGLDADMALPALLEMLHRKDLNQNLRLKLLIATAWISDEKAEEISVPALVEFLSRVSGEAAYSGGLRIVLLAHPKKAIPLLLKNIASSENAESSLRLLGDFQTEDSAATQDLLKTLGQSERKDRPAIWYAFLSTADDRTITAHLETILREYLSRETQYEFPQGFFRRLLEHLNPEKRQLIPYLQSKMESYCRGRYFDSDNMTSMLSSEKKQREDLYCMDVPLMLAKLGLADEEADIIFSRIDDDGIAWNRELLMTVFSLPFNAANRNRLLAIAARRRDVVYEEATIRLTSNPEAIQRFLQHTSMPDPDTGWRYLKAKTAGDLHNTLHLDGLNALIDIIENDTEDLNRDHLLVETIGAIRQYGPEATSAFSSLRKLTRHSNPFVRKKARDTLLELSSQ